MYVMANQPLNPRTIPYYFGLFCFNTQSKEILRKEALRTMWIRFWVFYPLSPHVDKFTMYMDFISKVDILHYFVLLLVLLLMYLQLSSLEKHRNLSLPDSYPLLMYDLFSDGPEVLLLPQCVPINPKWVSLFFLFRHINNLHHLTGTTHAGDLSLSFYTREETEWARK